jgi:hypothetical protein
MTLKPNLQQLFDGREVLKLSIQRLGLRSLCTYSTQIGSGLTRAYAGGIEFWYA